MSDVVSQRLLLLLLCLLTGCTEYGVTTSTGTSADVVTQQLPAQLVSELIAQPGKEPGLDCFLGVRNESDISRDLVFEQTGCSCYGVALGDRQLMRGDRITFAPQESQTFQLEIKPPRQQSQTDYRASFHWESATGNVPLQLEARLTVHEDVRVNPPAFSRNLLPSELEQPFRETFEVTHVVRERDLVEAKPTIDISEPSVSVERIQSSGPVEPLEDGLWKQVWKVFLQITPPVDLKPDSYPVNIRCAFPGSQEIPAAATAQVILRLKTPLQFPESIYLGRIPVGQQRTRKILIRSTDDEPFQLSVSKESSTEVQVKVSDQSAAEHWVEVAVLPTIEGEFSHRVELDSTHSRVPRVKLLISGTSFIPPAE